MKETKNSSGLASGRGQHLTSLPRGQGTYQILLTLSLLSAKFISVELAVRALKTGGGRGRLGGLK